MKIIICFLMFIIPSFAHSAGLSCHSSHGGYCQYLGKVSRLYVNGSFMLLYFDTQINSDEISKSGLVVTNTDAATLSIKNNVEFSKMVYSTLLSAQATQRDVQVQMFSEESGYLKIEKIWLDQ